MPTPLSDSDKVLRNDTGKDMVSQLTAIAQALGVGVNADQINYDNTESGLTADNAQDAIDEIKDITDDLDEKIDDKTSYESTASGSIVTFNDGGNNIPMKSCEVAIVAQQAGSGTPSPSNPRAITGYDGVDVNVKSNNLFDNTSTPFKTGQYVSSVSGNVVSYTANADYNVYKMPISRNVYISRIKGETPMWVVLDTSDNVLQSNNIGAGTTEKTFTITNSNDGYLLLSVAVSGIRKCDDILSVYNGNVYTLPLPATCYGGTAELVGGNGTKTHNEVDLGSLAWASTSQNRWYSAGIAALTAVPSSSSTKAGLICSNYEEKTADETYLQNMGVALGTNGNLLIYDSALVGKTAEQVKTALTGVQLVYPLATPTAFTFTGATIPTLSGVNNVYADSGDVNALEYFNENADEIADAIRSVTTNKMDKVNPTGSGVFNFDGNGVLAGDLTIKGNMSVYDNLNGTVTTQTVDGITWTIVKQGRLYEFHAVIPVQLTTPTMWGGLYVYRNTTSIYALPITLTEKLCDISYGTGTFSFWQVMYTDLGAYYKSRTTADIARPTAASGTSIDVHKYIRGYV